MYTGFFVRLIVRLYVLLFIEHLKVAGYTLMTPYEEGLFYNTHLKSDYYKTKVCVPFFQTRFNSSMHHHECNIINNVFLIVQLFIA